MATPIDGFRKNLDAQLPELVAECEGRVAAAEANLTEQRDALAYVRSLAAQHRAMTPNPSEPEPASSGPTLVAA